MTAQERLDLIELGHRVTRCLKSENAEPDRVERVAGRAARGLALARRERDHQEFCRRFGKRSWFDAA